MFGYIYLTTNLINNRKYIGMHKASKFDPNYKGSGKILKLANEDLSVYLNEGWSIGRTNGHSKSKRATTIESITNEKDISE